MKKNAAELEDLIAEEMESSKECASALERLADVILGDEGADDLESRALQMAELFELMTGERASAHNASGPGEGPEVHREPAVSSIDFKPSSLRAFKRAISQPASDLLTCAPATRGGQQARKQLGIVKIAVTKINRVDQALRTVSADLESGPEAIRKQVADISGPYHWRKVKATDHFTPHSFGIAIDTSPGKAGYWRRVKPDESGRYRWCSCIPCEIVEISEKHGFIWAGRRYHFDYIHFEFLPELAPSKSSECRTLSLHCAPERGSMPGRVDHGTGNRAGGCETNSGRTLPGGSFKG